MLNTEYKEYTQLSANDSKQDDSSRSYHRTRNIQSQRQLRYYCIFSYLSSLIILILSAILIFQNRGISTQQQTKSGLWSPFEIQAAKNQITLNMKTTQFTGGLKIVDGIGLVRDTDPNQPLYVGHPSSEIDAAWDELVYPLNVFITRKEMEGSETGASPDPETGLYVVMPQGFHDLHCLNMIRQRLHLDYYVNLAQMNRTDLNTHTDHCIDSLRQSLMCTADMTLIKEYWIPERHRMMADFNNIHQCRDFNSIKSWLSDRSAEDTSPWQQNANELNME